MSIQNKNDDGKSHVGDITLDSLEGKGSAHTSILIILLLIFSGLSAFALGRLSVQRNDNQRGVVIETVAPEFRSRSEETLHTIPRGQERSETTTETPLLVGSKNSDKYHFPWCSGAKRIKPENIVSFSSYEEARSAGYTPASNCDGLQ